MITKKEAKHISELINTLSVSRMFVDEGLTKKDSDLVDTWMLAHDEACDILQVNFKITVSKYNFRKYYL
jgi:hypothetical protein